IARHNGLDRANDHARRLELFFDSMRAEVALLSGVRVWIDVKRVVGAGLHARLATDATISAEVDDAVVAPEQSGHRTDRDARRIFAVITTQNRKESACVGIFTLLDVLDPRAKSAKRDFVFGLAGYGAGVTADAFTMIDDEPVFYLCLIVTDSMKRRDTIQLSPRWPAGADTGSAVKDVAGLELRLLSVLCVLRG